MVQQLVSLVLGLFRLTMMYTPGNTSADALCTHAAMEDCCTPQVARPAITVLGAGCRVLGAGCWVLGAGCRAAGRTNNEGLGYKGPGMYLCVAASIYIYT